MHEWPCVSRIPWRVMGTNVRRSLLLGIFLACVIVPAASGYRTEHVIIVVFDGVRQEEMFEDPSHANIPVLWNVLVPNGTLYPDVWNGNDFTTTQPGHATLMTGAYEPGMMRAGTRPANVTLFELLREQTGAGPGSCHIVSQKVKNPKVAQWSTAPGYGRELGATFTCTTPVPVPRKYSDGRTLKAAKKILARDEVRVLLLNLGWTDRAAHSSTWEDYLQAIRTSDRVAGRLWKFVQSDPGYVNETTLILTSDHGREIVDWRSHVNGEASCRHVWALVIGPDTPAGVTRGQKADMRRIEPTAATLLGVQNPVGLMAPFPGAIFPDWTSKSFREACSSVHATGLLRVT